MKDQNTESLRPLVKVVCGTTLSSGSLFACGTTPSNQKLMSESEKNRNMKSLTETTIIIFFTEFL